MVTFVVAALAAASATYWALQWTGAPPQPASTGAPPAAPRQSDPQRVARLLGAGPSAVAVSAPDATASRFKLSGVVASRGNNGYAIISVDGKPARPYRVGSQLSDTLLLQSLAPRSAALASSADAPVSVTLELPNAGASTGAVPGRQRNAARSASTTAQ